MHLLDLTLPAIEANLALDEVLLLEAEAGGPEVLRFWEWPPAPQPNSYAVVLGAGGKWAEEADAPACERDGVPILRRSSGGGAVLLGPGCLLFTLVLRYESQPALADLHASYRFILGKIADALALLVPGLELAGISDLAVAGKKCSGNSQQRKRTHLLHHGTLLCSFDLAAVARYLRHPPREPEYRRQRSHLEFVTNLHVAIPDVKNGLRNAWHAKEVLTQWPQERVAHLLHEKYRRADWHQRR